jgi:hypothetical protein
MARRAPIRAMRETRRTALLVGEGLAEQQFLSHLKALYVVRGSMSVTIKNARGKGGQHVLHFTLRQRLQAEFDQVGTLLDTDKDWGEPQRSLAREKSVQVFEATPCLEALLLRVATGRVPSGDTTTCKEAFFDRFQAHAHDAKMYTRAFGKSVLDDARARVSELDALLKFLGT